MPWFRPQVTILALLETLPTSTLAHRSGAYWFLASAFFHGGFGISTVRKVLPASPAPTTCLTSSLRGSRARFSQIYRACDTVVAFQNRLRGTRREAPHLFCNIACVHHIWMIQTCVLVSLHLTQRVQRVSKRKHQVSQLWVTSFCMLRTSMKQQKCVTCLKGKPKNSAIFVVPNPQAVIFSVEHKRRFNTALFHTMVHSDHVCQASNKLIKKPKIIRTAQNKSE